jgi:phosphatidylglycerophosphate synthase
MMPHAHTVLPVVAGLVLGTSPLRVWGLLSPVRLQRQLLRARATASLADAQRVLLLRADWVYDDALVRGMAGMPSDGALCAADDTCVALNVPAGQQLAVGEALLAGRVPQGIPRCEPAQVAGNYNDTLRKREPPYLLRLTPANIGAVESRTFQGSYKGVTDFVTLHVWPRPARVVTRFCAEHGITPNMVTSLSLVMVLLAMWAFWHGHYIWGLLAAWPMTFLDTVDGKLARVTLQSSRFGDVFDHGIDLIHPPFWWWAWIVGLMSAGFVFEWADATLLVIVGGYVLQRLEEGAFIAWFKMDMHVWQRFDSWLRLYTARRNPNLVILTIAVLLGRPDIGIATVAAWVAICLIVHAVRLIQAGFARRHGPLRSWLA